MSHSGSVISNSRSIKIVECEECGFRHRDPLPSAEELRSFYSEDFYKSESKSDYLEYTEKDLEYRNLLHQDKLTLIEVYVKSINSKRILDIGSGGGLFVEYFSDRGWQAMGIEPSSTAHAFAVERGRSSLNVDVETYLASDTAIQYDVVHMRECLDGILNPFDVLKQIYEQLLVTNGILVIDTSNDFNPLQKAHCQNTGVREWWLDGDVVNFFTSRSLETVLKRVGFEIVHKEATFPIEIFLLMGEDYIVHPEIGPKVHRQRVKFESVLEATGQSDLKHSFFEAMAEIGLGRNIVMYARKN